MKKTHGILNMKCVAKGAIRTKLCLLALFTLGSSLFTICKGQAFYGSGFDSLSSGMTSPGAYVLALAMKDSSAYSPLYAGGHFAIAGRDTAVNIAEWIDTIPNSNSKGRWASVGKGVNNDVCALAMFNNYLYAGGKFDTAGGIACSHIARWDTVALAWDSLLGTLNGNIYALCVYNKALYVGGDFTIAGGDTVNRIAMWNDSAWVAVGNGFNTGAVYALTVSYDALYAGGSFIITNGLVVNHIAKWNGTYWDSLGSGTNNTVYALSSGPNYESIVAGGAFTKSGNIPTKYISGYNFNASGWDSIGSGTNDTVRALNAGWAGAGLIAVRPGQGLGGGNALYVGGNFDSAGGYRCHYIAGWWNGDWDTIGELNGPVFALANPYQSESEFGGGNNYVGGEFTTATNGNVVDTLNFVAYMGISLDEGGIPSIDNKSWVDVYPNPNNGKFTLRMKNDKLKMNNVEIYNILGEQVYSTKVSLWETLSIVHPGSYRDPWSIDLSSQPNGVYLYRVIAENGELMGEGKLVIQK